jgi:large repetitive protein
VTVVDDIPPTVTLNAGVDTIFIGSTWIDAGIQTSDNSEDPVTVEVLGMVNNMVAGEYAIIYEATDQSGNVTTVTRFVNVLSVD